MSQSCHIHCDFVYFIATLTDTTKQIIKGKFNVLACPVGMESAELYDAICNGLNEKLGLQYLTIYDESGIEANHYTCTNVGKFAGYDKDRKLTKDKQHEQS